MTPESLPAPESLKGIRGFRRVGLHPETAPFRVFGGRLIAVCLTTSELEGNFSVVCLR